MDRETLVCPQCGTSNRADAMNCAGCRISLAFTRERPAEVKRITPEDARSERRGSAVLDVFTARDKPILLPVLLLLGAFIFAFCLREAVHKLGHFPAHRACGTDADIKLDPLGGSQIVNGASAPRETWGITSAAGPLLNILAGVAVSLSLWRYRRTALLPLLLWGPIALVQEGVTLSLGMLTPGGGAELIVEAVVSSVALGLAMVLFQMALS